MPLPPGLLYLKYPRACEGPAPGPQAFDAGISKIEDALADQGLPVVRREQVIQATGLEAMWAVETDAVRLKTLMAAIEDGRRPGTAV